MKKLIAILMLCSFAVWAEPININQADADVIAKALTGVGPKKADAIVQYRKEHGDFKTLKDLEAVKGIGEKTALLNEKNIVFGDAAAAAVAAPGAVPEAKAPQVEKVVPVVKK